MDVVIVGGLTPPENRDKLTRALKRAGYEVIVANETPAGLNESKNEILHEIK